MLLAYNRVLPTEEPVWLRAAVHPTSRSPAPQPLGPLLVPPLLSRAPCPSKLAWGPHSPMLSRGPHPSLPSGGPCPSKPAWGPHSPMLFRGPCPSKLSRGPSPSLPAVQGPPFFQAGLGPPFPHAIQGPPSLPCQPCRTPPCAIEGAPVPPPPPVLSSSQDHCRESCVGRPLGYNSPACLCSSPGSAGR